MSVPLQICNGTVAMWYKFWDLAHLIKLQFYVWCGKCAKYLTFGTFATPATDALRKVLLFTTFLQYFHNKS